MLGLPEPKEAQVRRDQLVQTERKALLALKAHRETKAIKVDKGVLAPREPKAALALRELKAA